MSISTGFKTVLAAISFAFVTMAPVARADFRALLDPSQAGALQELCNDVDSVAQVILVFDKAVTLASTAMAGNPVTSTLADLANKSSTISKVCNVVLMAATAKNTAQALRAARALNRMGGFQLESSLNFAENTINFFQFADNLKNSRQSNKKKLLNPANYQRFLNYMFTNFPLNSYDERRRSRQHAKSTARMSVLADISSKVYGCRVPYFKPDPAKVQLADGPVDEATLTRWSMTMDRSNEIVNASENKIRTISKTLLDMISSVETQPNMVESSSSIITNFIRKGIWVSVGYELPQDRALQTGEVVTKPDPLYDYSPTPMPEQGIEPVRARNPTITTNDQRNVFYKEQGKKVITCSDQTKDLRRLLADPTILTDPFVRGEWIAETVTVCPIGDKMSVLSAVPVVAFAPLRNDSDLAEKMKNLNLEAEANCKKQNAKQVIEGLKDMRYLGNRESRYLVNPPDPCKRKKAQIDSYAPPTYAEIKNVSNIKEFVAHYNDLFNKYVLVNYSIELQENEFSEGARKVARSLADFMTEEDDGYGSRNQWNPQSGNYVTPEQRRFLNRWRSAASVCDIPRYLERKMSSDTEATAIIQNRTEHPTEYAALVERCFAEESNSDSNNDLFGEMFQALVDVLEQRAEAEASMFEIEVLAGSFKTQSSNKQESCEQDVTPADLTKEASKGQLVIIEQQEELVTLLTEIRDQNAKLDREKSEELERQKLRAVQAFHAMRRAALLEASDGYVPGTSSYQYKGFAPTILNQREMDEKFSPSGTSPLGRRAE